MARLAEYMHDLATLLGQVERVHFNRLEHGSVALIQDIEEPAYPKVRERLAGIEHGDAAPDALKAFRNLDNRLAQDNAVATLSSTGNTAEIIRFPGRDRPTPPTYGSFRQQGSLDGQLVWIGGVDETAHATLQDRDRTWKCRMRREMAREMRQYLYEQPLRVYGEGRWRRTSDGQWILERFTVSDFEVLDSSPWTSIVERLRTIQGSQWQYVNDLSAELERLRATNEEPH
jgi:hypothetical protein